MASLVFTEYLVYACSRIRLNFSSLAVHDFTPARVLAIRYALIETVFDTPEDEKNLLKTLRPPSLGTLNLCGGESTSGSTHGPSSLLTIRYGKSTSEVIKWSCDPRRHAFIDEFTTTDHIYVVFIKLTACGHQNTRRSTVHLPSSQLTNSALSPSITSLFCRIIESSLTHSQPWLESLIESPSFPQRPHVSFQF